MNESPKNKNKANNKVVKFGVRMKKKNADEWSNTNIIIVVRKTHMKKRIG